MLINNLNLNIIHFYFFKNYINFYIKTIINVEYLRIIFNISGIISNIKSLNINVKLFNNNYNNNIIYTFLFYNAY